MKEISFMLFKKHCLIIILLILFLNTCSKNGELLFKVILGNAVNRLWAPLIRAGTSPLQRAVTLLYRSEIKSYTKNRSKLYPSWIWRLIQSQSFIFIQPWIKIFSNRDLRVSKYHSLLNLSDCLLSEIVSKREWQNI